MTVTRLGGSPLDSPLTPVLVADLHARVLDLCPRKSLPTYRAGFERLIQRFGSFPLDGVQLTDLEKQRDDVREEVGRKRVADAIARGKHLRSYDPDAHGHGAAENYVRSVRFFFRVTVKEDLLSRSPAQELTAPPRPDAPERALTESELEDLRRIAETTGRDPELDLLILDFLRHTAARREGVLNLYLTHLHIEQQAVTLTEKRGRARTLPLSSAMLRRLLTFAKSRGATAPHDAVFRYSSGTPITRRRFNSLFDRLDRHCTWSDQLDVGAHWLRHTTLSDLAAASDQRVAGAYAGHRPGRRATIERYSHVEFDDLVDAYELLFGPRG
jgi:site-specific recombinase XerD